MQSKIKVGARYLIQMAVVASLVSAVSFSSAFATSPTDEVAAQAQTQAFDAWHEQLRKIAPPVAGCFHAVYPSLIWESESCGPVPNYRSAPHWAGRKVGNKPEDTAGNGYDYVAQTSTLTQSATGSFPTVTGVTSEKGANVPFGNGESDGITGKNEYTLQLNTNISDTVSPVCASYGDKECWTWQQFVYSTNNEDPSGAQAFIQNWLFVSEADYESNGCPNGWGDGGAGPTFGSVATEGCYTNSNAVNVTDVLATKLASEKLEGSTVSKGLDSVIFTYAGVAHTATQPDSTLDIASTWNQSEFNIVGNAGGSRADFNTGSSIKVKLTVDDGSTAAPTCISPSSYDGTTGETNNLNLGSCSAAGGSTPYIQFTESN